MILKTSGGIELFYEIYGEKGNTPVVLVHGLGAEHNMWLPQISKYPSQGIFVIAPDMRGHGKSSKVKSFQISDCARDIEELLEHLGIAKASLVGVSMGGLIIQQFALDFPKRVDKLVIADSYSTTKGIIRTMNAKFALFLFKFLSKKLIIKLLELPYKGADKENIRRYFREQLSKMDIEQVRLERNEVNRFGILDRLSEINVPTLVLVGDHFGKMAINMAKETANGIKGSQFKVLEGGGDPSNLMVPDLFDNEVLDFNKK